ncbi:hypothetical protein [Frankia sp. EAN1pec]
MTPGSEAPGKGSRAPRFAGLDPRHARYPLPGVEALPSDAAERKADL